MNFLDCQCLAGGYTLGAVQAGFKLTGVKTLAGFGVANLEANRAILGDHWETEVAADGSWDPQRDVQFLGGTPPCSGWSTINRSKGVNARGAESGIHQCTWELVHYASKCRGSDGKLGPDVVSFECVQEAYSQGRDLMQRYRDTLERATKQKYDLYHVLVSGASMGAAQRRHRYFWVASRVPLGWEPPVIKRIYTYMDALDDLLGLEMQWEAQPIVLDALGPYQKKMRKGAKGFVDSHTTAIEYALPRRLQVIAPFWCPGEHLSVAVKRYIDKHGPLPDEIFGSKHARYMQDEHFDYPARLIPDKLPYTLTGQGGIAYYHWSEDRNLTVRECARLMGFPDEWTWTAARSAVEAFRWVGKQIPVQSGNWMATNIKYSLEGDPGWWIGREIGERERVLDATHDYRAVYNPKTRERNDSRSQRWKDVMNVRKDEEAA